MMKRNDNARSAVRQALRNQDGGTLPMVAVGMLMAVGFSAMAVDMTSFYSIQSKLQSGADAVATAAAIELANPATATTTAEDYATLNLPASVHGATLNANDVQVGTWDEATRTFTAGAGTDAIQVTLRRAASNGNAPTTLFGGLMGVDTVDIAATAVAIRRTAERCIWVLDPSARGALKISGGAQVDTACGIGINSTDGDAIDQVGSSCLTTTTLQVAGGANMSCSNVSAWEGYPPFDDPLASIPPPTVGPCDHTGVMNINGTVTLNPGVYCGNVNIHSSGQVTSHHSDQIHRSLGRAQGWLRQSRSSQTCPSRSVQ